MYLVLQISVYLLEIFVVIIIIREMYGSIITAEGNLRLINVSRYLPMTICGLSAILLTEIAGRIIFNKFIENVYLSDSGIATEECNLLCTYLPFYFFMLLGCIFLYLYKWVKRKERIKNAAIYPVFLTGQFLIWFGYIQGTMQREGKAILFFQFGFLAGAAADVILLYMVFEKSRKDKLEKELNEMRAVHELKKKHYEKVTYLQSEMLSIKRELSGQLDALFCYIEQPDQKDEVKQLLEELTQRIESTRTMNYFPLPVLNAVLAEKAEFCGKNNISLRMDIRMEREYNIDKVHLCSIFSNLLDNAIHACLELYDQKEKEIWIHAVKMQDYLYIKTTNPCLDKKDKEKRKWHGYGIKIMQEIAGKYNGAYQGNVKDNVYTALVTLQIQEDSR